MLAGDLSGFSKVLRRRSAGGVPSAFSPIGPVRLVFVAIGSGPSALSRELIWNHDRVLPVGAEFDADVSPNTGRF